MNIIKNCKDTRDAIEFFPAQGLYLKPVARLNISVQLPQMKFSGKTISNSELMEKLRSMISPDEFIILRVVKSTLEFIRFEGEIENKSCLHNVVGRLDNRTLKLTNFSEFLKVRAAEAKIVFPTRHSWDAYFRDARNMNEMKPGERPDTIHINNLPCRWFSTKKDLVKAVVRPSEYVLQKVFEAFGEVRCVDIPTTDLHRTKLKLHTSGINTFSFGQDHTFEAYIQYKEYICFVKAMDALRGMKLLYKEGDKAYTANIKVDFDKTKHLSDVSIQQRLEERKKLIAEQHTEDKQQEGEVKRQKKTCKQGKKRKHERLVKDSTEKKDSNRSQETDSEERKLIIAQRKLESVRLLQTLFARIKMRRQKKEEMLQAEHKEEQHKAELKQKKAKMKKKLLGDAQKNKEKRSEQVEKELRERLIRKYKLLQKLQMKEQKDKRTCPASDEQSDAHCSMPSSRKKDIRDSSLQTSNSRSSVSSKKTYKKKHKQKKRKSRTWHRKFHDRMGHHPCLKNVGNYIYAGCNNYFYHSSEFQCVPESYPEYDFHVPHWNPGMLDRKKQQTLNYCDASDEYYRYFKKVSKLGTKSDEENSENSTSSDSQSVSRHTRKKEKSKSSERCPCVSENSSNSISHNYFSSTSSNLPSVVVQKNETKDKISKSCHRNSEVQIKWKQKSKRSDRR